jgi:hypothetical protein
VERVADRGQVLRVTADQRGIGLGGESVGQGERGSHGWHGGRSCTARGVVRQAPASSMV